jgi:heme exporter protein A
MIQLEVKNLSRYFEQRCVFQGLNFKLEKGNILMVVGKNGSGKTTLLRILAGILSPTRGEVLYTVNGDKIKGGELQRIMSLVAPDLNLYDELTALENLKFVSKVQGFDFEEEKLIEKMNEVGLGKRAFDLVGSFSTGMKQRLKYVSALLKKPLVLFLDEPKANLDQEGVLFFEKVIQDQKQRGILIWATNKSEERKYGDQILQLDK